VPAFRGTAWVVAIAMCVVTSAMPAAAHDATAQGFAPGQADETVDLAPALGPDGTFQGAPGVSGTIDASAWSLVSDLSAGEAPRFAPTSRARSSRDSLTTTQSGSVGTATWSALGSNEAGNGALTGPVRALVVYGTTLYVGGDFTDAAGIPEADFVVAWDGDSWGALGSNGAGNGALGSTVFTLDTYGSGYVYVGGAFTNAAGIPEADRVALWSQNHGWQALGSDGSGNGALNGAVRVISGVDHLVVGGTFTNAAGIPEADYVAEWAGGAWHKLGSNGPGIGALNAGVYALATAANGVGVYAAGDFTNAAGIATADRVALYDGVNGWSSLGSNGSGDGALNSSAIALVLSAGNLYVGGGFTNAAGIAAADRVARWNGSVWSALGSDGSGDGALNGTVRALTVSGTDVYVGGDFVNAAGVAEADRIARWYGGHWSSMGSNGSGNGALADSVLALAAVGSAVYTGGLFTNAAGIAAADYAALALVPGPWSALGSDGAGNGALNRVGFSLASIGTDLYVGGAFVNAAGKAKADYLARWDGSSWFAVGSNGSGDGALNGFIYALAVSGTDLYIGGDFTGAAGIATADYVAHWNGTTWSGLGSDGSGDGALDGIVFALAASGANVYAGGLFTNAAGQPQADYLARWSGTSWSSLGANGADGALSNFVTALALSGSDLYVGGAFVNAAGISEADRIARWDGSHWSALGSNGAGDGALEHEADALAVTSAGLYAGGAFTNAAGIREADYVALWNGTAWSALGSGQPTAYGALNQQVFALYGFGTDLYVGGDFTDAPFGFGDGTADYVARWNGTSWYALGSNGVGNGALGGKVRSLKAMGNRLFVAGYFTNADGIPAADSIAAWAIVYHQPDGRIRRGSGTYVGNDIYNDDGTGQARTGSATPGSTIKFGISVQNDGNVSQNLTVHATGTTQAGYRVRYFHGTTEITTAVVAGSFETPVLAAGGAYLVTAKVKVLANAAVGSSVIRLVTLTSESEPAKTDTVKFVVSRT
jgi:hypothetical protein